MPRAINNRPITKGILIAPDFLLVLFSSFDILFQLVFPKLLLIHKKLVRPMFLVCRRYICNWRFCILRFRICFEKKWCLFFLLIGLFGFDHLVPVGFELRFEIRFFVDLGFGIVFGRSIDFVIDEFRYKVPILFFGFE